MNPLRLALLLMFLWLLATDARAQADPPPQDYTFTLDGAVIHPPTISLNATPERLQPGDLVCIADIWLTLGDEKQCAFRSTPEEDGRLFLLRKGAAAEVAAVKVSWTFKDETKIIFNPLARVTAAETARLRGIRLDGWTEEVRDRLRHIDPRLACVTVTDSALSQPDGKLPPLPGALQYLRIEERSNVGGRDYSGLRQQTALRFLAVRSMTGTVDLRDLAKAIHLRYLSVLGGEAGNLDALAALKELRVIGLAFADGVGSVAFAADLDTLVKLDVRRARVADLSPMGGLRALQPVLASEIKIRPLPPEEAVEPGGWVTARPGDTEMQKGSDRAYAGLMLANLGMHASLPALRLQARSADGEDREILNRAIATLEKKQP